MDMYGSGPSDLLVKSYIKLASLRFNSFQALYSIESNTIEFFLSISVLRVLIYL